MKNQSLINSERAKKGNLLIENKICKFCGHNRMFNMFDNSGNLRVKCCKCKRLQND